MKEINAILIDVNNDEIKGVKVPVDKAYKQYWETIYKLCGWNCGTLVQIRDGNMVVVDDEGLLKNPTKGFFVLDYHQPLAGNGMIVGPEVDGVVQDCSLSVEDAKRIINIISF